MKPYKGGVRHDYKDACLLAPALRRQRQWSFFLLGLALPIVTVSLMLVSEPNESKVPHDAESTLADPLREIALEVPPRLTLGTAPPLDVLGARDAIAAAESAEPLPMPVPPRSLTMAGAQSLVADAAATMLELVVKPGDSLERLFRRNGLSLTDLAAMVRLDNAANYLKLLKPGDTIRIAHRDGEVLSLFREIDKVKLLSIARAESGFDARTIELPVDIREQSATASISSSLFEAGTAAGMSDAVTMAMAGIFQWDIDFLQDVRVGDTFTVIYEEHWRDGVKLRDGPIVAAEFVNRGRSYRAARYTDATGRTDYFTPDGRSVRKAFIRAPVDFSRISSNFDPNRRHPVLNTIRAHRGVDYAAPTGTPVKAAGDGKITSRGSNGGYGNAVILQHGGNITTLYAHLSRFGSQKAGTRVRQGDIIGYVGSSGLATGPHLHYEYRVNGVHRNPRTVTLPPADPVPRE